MRDAAIGGRTALGSAGILLDEIGEPQFAERPAHCTWVRR
jgi:hypothetical protein